MEEGPARKEKRISLFSSTEHANSTMGRDSCDYVLQLHCYIILSIF